MNCAGNARKGIARNAVGDVRIKRQTEEEARSRIGNLGFKVLAATLQDQGGPLGSIQVVCRVASPI